MLDHVGLEVTDFDRSRAFYVAALVPLGLEPLMEPAPGICGFGDPSVGKPFFWINERGRAPVSGAHVAFEAAGTEAVDAFHAAALAAGAPTTARPARGRCTTRATTGPSCTTSTATTWRPSSTGPERPRGVSEERMKGLEPSTFCMASRRSSQLSYIRGSRQSTGRDEALQAAPPGPGAPRAGGARRP